MKTRAFTTRIPTALLSLCIICPLCAGDELGEAGRKLLEQHSQAIVTIQVVMKQQMNMFGSSREEESKTEITGTVINPSGLTVTSLSSLDPGSIIMDMMGGQTGLGAFDMDMKSQVTSATLLLEDGTELPGRVVLRDPDLDLAFVQPDEKPEKALPHLDLSNSAEPEVLESIISLGRLGKLARRKETAAIGRITARVDKPRPFYVPAVSLASDLPLGCPVFTPDGATVGLIVMRKGASPGGGSLTGMLTSALSFSDFMMFIVVPAKDVAEAAEQAPGFDDDTDSAE